MQNQELKNRIEEKIQKDLDNGKFYSICSNETTFKNYVSDKLIKVVVEYIDNKIKTHQNFITMTDYDVGYTDCKENIRTLLNNLTKDTNLKSSVTSKTSDEKSN